MRHRRMKDGTRGPSGKGRSIDMGKRRETRPTKEPEPPNLAWRGYWDSSRQTRKRSIGRGNGELVPEGSQCNLTHGSC